MSDGSGIDVWDELQYMYWRQAKKISEDGK